jgi:DinB family protein
MRAAAHQCAFLLAQYERFLEGLEDRHCALEPVPGTKTAGWLIGHLVVTGDFARRLCGLKPLLPKEWRPLFSPGTQPSLDAAAYPPMAELVDAFRAIHRDLAASAPAASAETLAAPNPYEPTRGEYPTAGSFATYLLTGHLGFHLGQLSIWRAAAAAGDPALRRSA